MIMSTLAENHEHWVSTKLGTELDLDIHKLAVMEPAMTVIYQNHLTAEADRYSYTNSALNLFIHLLDQLEQAANKRQTESSATQHDEQKAVHLIHLSSSGTIPGP